MGDYGVNQDLVQSLSLSLWLFLSRPVTIRVPGLLCRVLLGQFQLL